MPRVRVGNLSPEKRQKIIANVRAGQAAFNQMNANMRREEQLVNNIAKLRGSAIKVMRLQSARPSVHPEGSNANRRNNAINARLQRNIERRNQEIQRLETNLVTLRRRLLGISAHLSNHNVLMGVNFGVYKAIINRMRMKRLARLITEAYVKPGGKFSRNLVSDIQKHAARRN
jgi:hypothetical protein